MFNTKPGKNMMLALVLVLADIKEAMAS